MKSALLALAALGVLHGPGAEAKSVEVDPQFWGEIDLKTMVAGIEVTALGLVRQSTDLPNPTLYGGGLVLGTDLSESWLVETGELWVRARNESGASLDVQVPLAAASYRWHWGDLGLSERIRFERLDGVPGEPWRYRNRLSASYPLDLGPPRAIIASDEVFYDFGHSAWSRNRAQLALELAHAGPASLTIAYLRQDDRFAHPAAINAACTTLVLNLP